MEKQFELQFISTGGKTKKIVNGSDREAMQRDLYNAIEQGKFPKWRIYIQVMTEEEAEECPFNPFDLTKAWPKADYPLYEVGEFELNRNPENYFQDVEEAAFSPANLVPGIGVSPAPMLQARLFSYPDAQRYRLGVNYHQIPVNAPHGVANPHFYSRDGQGRMDGNNGSEVHIIRRTVTVTTRITAISRNRPSRVTT